MMPKSNYWLLCFVVFAFFLHSNSIISQEILYQDVCNCGVTGAGFSTGLGSGSGSFDIYIEPGSTIRKAYLFTYSMVEADSVHFLLNNDTISFFDHQAINIYDHKNTYSSPIKFFAKDITSSINPLVTNYNVIIPVQNYPLINQSFWTVYLLIVYENSSFTHTNVTIVTNQMDAFGAYDYTISSLNPINTSFPVGFSIYSDRFGNPLNTESLISFNSVNIGLIGGRDQVNSNWFSSGVKGHFYYQNNSLFALDDDNINLQMVGSDGLSDVSSLVVNNSTGVNFQFQLLDFPDQPPIATPTNLAYFLTYTTPCDTFTVTTTADTTVCYGEELQLSASGGQAYEWRAMKGGNVNGNVPGLSCSDCPNPVFTADSSMTCTVRIWNTDSCSVVRPIAIRVSGSEKLGAYSLPTECGASTGSLVVDAVPQEAANWFAVTPNNDTLTTADAVGNTLSDLAAGVYRLFYSDTVGCVSRDTLVEIDTHNSTVADFTVQPTTGAAPLEINIENLSQNATASEWYLNENYVGTSPPQLLDTAGSFEITLVAWQNDLTCADTVTKTVLVYDSLMVTIPNVFTPNGDGVNDFFTVGVNLPVKVDLTIVNRWGNTVFTHQEAISKGQHKLWNSSLSSGEQVNDGVYFYTLRFTLEGQAQETVTKTGFVHVFWEQ